ncbi:MAG TPA: c-type cytochrome [Pyrinomonadaceae bacterium]|nr:c-type cytochrome [Pyrinomonadaceae bacterium]
MTANRNSETARKRVSPITHHLSLITRSLSLITFFCFVVFAVSCEREERGFRVEPPSSARVNTIRQTELQPGTPIPAAQTVNEYEENAFAVSEGKRLYEWYNCVGCHARGGGGMGPPLMDEKWIYGSDPAQVFATIVEGRPNGMPSFRGKVPDYQVWQLVAYVRSMSGQVSKDVASGRDDNMSTKKPEQATEVMTPTPSAGVPKSAEMPK